MNNNILTKIVIACLFSCFTLVFAEDQVKPTVEKLAIEQRLTADQKMAIEKEEAKAIEDAKRQSFLLETESIEEDCTEAIEQNSRIKVLKQERIGKKEIPVPEYDYNKGVAKTAPISLELFETKAVEQKSLIKVLEQERQGKREIFVPEYNPNEGVDKEASILNSSFENLPTPQDKINYYNSLKPGVALNTVIFEDITVTRGTYSLTVGGGTYDSEISWAVDGQTGAAGAFTLDLDDGTYTFIGYDSYGDGWNGASANMTDDAGNSIISGFAVVGSESSIDFSAPFVAPDACTDSAIFFNLVDSYGDGWNGGFLTFAGDDMTIVSGSEASFEYCLVDGDYTYTYTAGSWAAENSYSVTDADGITLSSGDSTSGGGSFTVGGAPPVGGCTDADAPNYNPDAEVNDGSCDAYCGSTDCGGFLVIGYTCEELVGYGYDCSVCEADGGCSAAFVCADGTEADTPEDCESCAYDYTDFGAASCDAAWVDFGVDCATMEAAYSWDCTGCACPGDPFCGDGECNGNETNASCPGDCDALSCAEGESAYTLVVGGGTYDGEMSWQLENSAGVLVVDECEDADENGICDGGANGTFELCLADDSYFFYGYDSYGDGWNGGYWEIFDADGNSVAGGPDYTITENNYYGWGWGWNLCLGACGCTWENASNYDADATIEDWSCDLEPGSDCSYWGDEYIGFEAGCGGVHCYSDYQGELGNGECNAHAANCDDDPYGWCHGMACAYFACDGGDCSQGDDADGECYEAPATCEDTECTLDMVDSWGDG